MRYVCSICGYVYDEEVEGTPFDDLPDTWTCPLCGAAKSTFDPEASPEKAAPAEPARADAATYGSINDFDFAWISEAAQGYDVSILDESGNYGQIALQGPDSQRIASEVLGFDVSELVFYTFIETDFAGGKVIVSRSGYTGEDGFEFYASPDIVRRIWAALLGAKVRPCGLGCRDTLRFEVGLPLYGHELGPDISPLEAGLGIFVRTDKPEFIGKEAMERLKAEGVKRRLVGIELIGRAIPRSGYPVEAGGRQIGEVTTGYISISSGKSVCLAFVESEYAAEGTPVEVRIRKKVFPGKVCRKKFYEKKYRR